MLWLILAAACTGGPAPEAIVVDPTIDAGWVPRLMRSPADFDALVSADHAGWVAVHGADWRAEATAPGPAARLRERRAATLDHALRLHAAAWTTLAARWASRGEPNGAALIAAVARAAQVDAGLDPERSAASGAVPGPDAAALLAWSGEVDPPEVGPLTGCLKRHLEARAAGALTTCAGLGALEPPIPDPFALQTARLAWGRSAGQGATVPGDNLEHAIFSERWLGGPAEADGGALLPALGLSLSGATDAQALRDQAHALDAALDAADARWRASAPAEGQALVSELDLIGVWRSRALTAAADQLLTEGQPEAAAAALQLAHDATQGRAQSPRNTPELRLLTAEAALKLGRGREALDALAPLREGWPELRVISEIIDDVVVLESLGRVGESQEH